MLIEVAVPVVPLMPSHRLSTTIRPFLHLAAFHPSATMYKHSRQNALIIYPPILPPSDFFDLEAEAEKLKDMFKYDNSLKNPLYDETGLVNLPVDDKGNLILDPESRTKMVDVEVELDVLYEYMAWMGSAAKEEGMGEEGKKKWLEGLREAVNEDLGEVFDEWHEVVDEERSKRGLTDRYTHWGWYKKQTLDSGKKKWTCDSAQRESESWEVDQEPTPLVPSSDGEADEGALLPDKTSSINEKVEEQMSAETVSCPFTEVSVESESASEAPPITLITLWW